MNFFGKNILVGRKKFLPIFFLEQIVMSGLRIQFKLIRAKIFGPPSLEREGFSGV